MEANKKMEQLSRTLSDPATSVDEMFAAVRTYLEEVSQDVEAEVQAVYAQLDEMDSLLGGTHERLEAELRGELERLRANRQAAELRYQAQKERIENQRQDLKKLSFALERIRNLQDKYEHFRNGRGYQWIWAELSIKRNIKNAKEAYERLKEEYQVKWEDPQ